MPVPGSKHRSLAEAIDAHARERGLVPFTSWEDVEQGQREQQEAEARQEWIRYHREQAARYAWLADEHQQRADRLEGRCG